MKDFLGNELQVGDEVVFVTARDGELSKGKVTNFQDNLVIVETGWSHLPEICAWNTEIIKVIRQ